MTDESNRREFLKAATCLVGGALCGASGCSGIQHVRAERTEEQLVVEAGDLDDTGGVLVHHPSLDNPLYLHRSSKPVAVSTACTHKGCRVEPTGDRFVCPCHGSRFDGDGAVLEGPADRPLMQFRVERHDDQLVISLPTPD